MGLVLVGSRSLQGKIGAGEEKRRVVETPQYKPSPLGMYALARTPPPAVGSGNVDLVTAVRKSWSESRAEGSRANHRARGSISAGGQSEPIVRLGRRLVASHCKRTGVACLDTTRAKKAPRRGGDSLRAVACGDAYGS
jgi:hypothetical protein